MTPLVDISPHDGAPPTSTYRSHRGIGPWGTAARVAVGGFMLGDVVYGHATGGWRLAPWLLAVAVLPGAMLALHGLLARAHPGRIEAAGPLWHAVNIGVFLALWLMPEYAPALEPMSDAALIFYGASMLVAATRGTSCCEVAVLSNWLLRRDDEISCALFLPVDIAEASRIQKRRDG
jgi:hypothetical protein